ncbi:hypothetical protein D3C74_340530 [compost metagenome]
MLINPRFSNGTTVDIHHDNRFTQLMYLLHQLQLNTHEIQGSPVNALAALHIIPWIIRYHRRSCPQVDRTFTKIAGAGPTHHHHDDIGLFRTGERLCKTLFGIAFNPATRCVQHLPRIRAKLARNAIQYGDDLFSRLWRGIVPKLVIDMVRVRTNHS